MICIKIVTAFQVPQPKATKICIIPLDTALTPSPSPPVNLFKSDPIRLDKFKKIQSTLCRIRRSSLAKTKCIVTSTIKVISKLDKSVINKVNGRNLKF